MQPIKLLLPDLPLAEDLLPLLRRIDATRWYTNFGPLVKEFEAKLSQQWPIPLALSMGELPALQVVTLNSGTAPLELGIAALGLPQGSNVLLPSFSFPATASALLRNNLKPVFSDVAADSWQLTPSLARATAAQHPLALVMPVATFGCPLDVVAWDKFVEDTGIPVLMDAAAAFGNQAIGRLVHASFSLHATKPFGIGEGGLFVTRDAELSERVRRLSNFGFENELSTLVGTNAKLSEYAAAIALVQWSRWPEMQIRRRAQWAHYHECLAALDEVQCQSGFETSMPPANLIVTLPMAAEVVARALSQSGIETRRWYYPPLHRHPAFERYSGHWGTPATSLAVTEKLAYCALGLPWHHLLSQAAMQQIALALAQALNSAKSR
ncbi:DegT/DnrJ/EryC1/StrS family aminotransferase [Rhodoferax sp.]|uniref:DegT/DnrJ/EryC1/StrS family aminotransferase n=1 Tax=Rhodoferax sp. TaxID=50421 RepID=UPI0026151F8A|nr:DegT/DnrJ/EryC1/StrS family aminotransferase [Rhodoferax sp.]